jgi:glycosyltransferase involved in cell wall biosynthesis
MVRPGYYPLMQPNKRNAETLVAHGYEVDVICLSTRGQKKKEVINGVNIYRFPWEHHRGGFIRYFWEYLAFFVSASFRLLWLSVKKRYQIIEVSGMPDFMVFTAIIPKMLGSVVVLNLYDHVPESFMQYFKVGQGNLIVKILRKLEKLSVRWVDYCLGTQSITKQKIESHGVPGSRITIIPNVPAEDFTSSGFTPPEKREEFKVITHGSLLEIYGVQTLIKAVPLLIEKIPELKVSIVGTGEYKPQLETLAESLGVTDYVDFVGFVDRSEIPGYIADADIGIVTILAQDNPMLPNKLFEYLDIGKPVISTSIPAITTYFGDEALMYYKPDDEHDLARCILELYNDQEKRAALATSGAAAYDKFRWNVTKQEYLDVFKRLIESHR